MYSFAALLVLAVSIGIPTAAADLIGSVAKAPQAETEVNRRLQEICSCSPRSYTFQFNLNQTCANNTIADNSGVAETACFVAPFDDLDGVDLTPIRISAVRIIEIGRNGTPLAVEQMTGEFNDGDTFSYTSISTQLDPDERLEDQEVPRSIQLRLNGVNDAGQILINDIAVVYDLTNCAAESIGLGDTIGWVEVVEFTSAAAVFCPAIETEPPTSLPSLSPTTSEPTTEQPTTGQPTPIPTNPPTFLCSCSPRSYTFQLNLDQTCANNTIEGNSGVSRTICFLGQGTPTQIESIYISERDRQLVTIGERTLSGNLNDGYEFTFTSNSAKLNPDVPLEDQNLPYEIQLNLSGKTEGGGGIFNAFTVTYDLTNCDTEPIQIGDQIGLVQVIEYTSAKPEFCPAVQTYPPTPSPISMSYSASFSLAHISKASKGKAAKGGVSKSGKLIRERK